MIIASLRKLGLVLLLLCAACSSDSSTDSPYPPGLEQQAKKDFLRLQHEGKVEVFEFPGIDSVSTYFSTDTAKHVVYIEYPHEKYDKGITLLQITYIKNKENFEFSSYTIRNTPNITTSISPPKKPSIEKINATSIIISAVGVLMFSVSISAAIMAFLTQGLKFKYLWLFGCFVGYGRIYAGWETGEIFFGTSLIQFTIPVFWFVPLLSEYFVRVSFPVVAALFFWLRFTGDLPVKGERS